MQSREDIPEGLSMVTVEWLTVASSVHLADILGYITSTATCLVKLWLPHAQRYKMRAWKQTTDLKFTVYCRGLVDSTGIRNETVYMST